MRNTRSLILVALAASILTACGTMPRVDVDTPEQGIAALRECKEIQGASCRVANGAFEGQVGAGAPLGDPNAVRARSFLGTPPPWYGTPVDPRFGYGGYGGYGGYYPRSRYGYPYSRGGIAVWGRF